MKYIISAVIVFLSTCANASVITNKQIDKINVPTDAYTNVGDQYSLSIFGPITSTVSINLANNAGCNLCNAIVQWGQAINNDPIMSSFLTASYSVWDGSVKPFGSGTIADYDASIYLTANVAGVAFDSIVSATSLTGIAKTNPLFSDLSVSVTTVVPARVNVPEPPAIVLFVMGGLVVMGARRWVSS